MTTTEHIHDWSDWESREVTETFIGLRPRDGHGQRSYMMNVRRCPCGARDKSVELPPPPMVIMRPGLFRRLLGRW